MARERDGNVSEQRVAAALDRAKLSYVHSTMVGPYEVDFRLGTKVIIEVDGYSHLTGAGRGRDQVKDRYLADLGFTVMRITGDQVHTAELTRFIDQVRAAVKAERARAESERNPGPFVDPKLERLRRQLIDNETHAAAVKPAPPAPDDDSELFLDWVGDKVRPPRGKRK